LGSSEESGKDWSDLEAEAAEADRHNNIYEEDVGRSRPGHKGGLKRPGMSSSSGRDRDRDKKSKP